uniref:Solute carrier family 25 member 46 n=2 Tax=Bactrocera latifrons TaxID=174628 RepID=A0A0K8WK36_BACLA
MRCQLCGSNQQDEIQYGPFIEKQNIAVHKFCLFFSSRLQGLKNDHYGFYEFFLDEISNQRRLFNRRNCCYCNKKTANISCSQRRCGRTFHFICGLQNGARNQFVAPFRSYCHRHVKSPKSLPNANEICCICHDEIFTGTTNFIPAKMLHSPCCRNNWFHKLCLQTYAHSAGDLFRCPLCNNKHKFLISMLYWGVCVPEVIGRVELQSNANAIEEEENEHSAHNIEALRGNQAILLLNEILMRRNDNRRQRYEEEIFSDHHYEHAQLPRYFEYAQLPRYPEYEQFPYVCDNGYGNSYLLKNKSKGLTWFSWFVDNVLSHPFIVLRQQCQVNNVARRFHLLPFSLVPIIIQLYYRQGPKTFWKGLGYSLILKGISWLIGNDTSAGETPLIVCIIRQCLEAAALGLKRLCLMSTVGNLGLPGIGCTNSTNSQRQISVKSLFFPYICMEIVKYEFRALVKNSTLAILRKKRKLKPTEFENQKMEIRSDLIARIITEVTFYPLETILNRLLLQDTDTIIDNLDNGKSLQPLITYYQGFGDCFNTIVIMEGYKGLYKGIGALFTQFSVHTVVVNVGIWIFS